MPNGTSDVSFNAHVLVLYLNTHSRICKLCRLHAGVWLLLVSAERMTRTEQGGNSSGFQREQRTKSVVLTKIAPLLGSWKSYSEGDFTQKILRQILSPVFSRGFCLFGWCKIAEKLVILVRVLVDFLNVVK